MSRRTALNTEVNYWIKKVLKNIEPKQSSEREQTNFRICLNNSWLSKTLDQLSTSEFTKTKWPNLTWQSADLN